MRVLHAERRQLASALERSLGAEYRSLLALWRVESDVVSVHVPLVDAVALRRVRRARS